MRRTISCLLLLCVSLPGLAQKKMYFEEIRKSAEKGWRENAQVIEEWKKGQTSHLLWGYNAPAHPIYLANLLAFLYEQTGERLYAQRSGQLLSTYGDLRSVLPRDYAATRVEYERGVPSLSNFFFLPPYMRAYLRVKDSGVLDAKADTKIQKEVAESTELLFRFPEWGGHNRAMLRAEAFRYAVLAMPRHGRAAAWNQMAEAIAADNLHHWEVEDASNYHPVWLHALLSYAEASNRPDVFTSPVMRYYYEYYLKQIDPTGTIPDYGDANWLSSAAGLRFTAIFEKGAAVCGDGELKWAAQSIFQTARARSDTLGVGDAYHLTDAYRWADESITPRRPTSMSQEVLDDLVGKKVVFRNGWTPASTYMMLNYRDEGDGGLLDRDYLRNTISVEEEKMHHGHADENSIVMLMHKGSLLLHDAGYRDALPSGRYGAYRQDYFHNRVVVRKDKRDKSQTLLEFHQNSGAYRKVRTQKIDFLNLRGLDMSRTRVLDENLGYQWDRTVTYVHDPGYFVVIDGITVLRPDYFTFSCLWHARDILKTGDHFADMATDSISPAFGFARGQSLLVYFPETYAKTEGVEPIQRHYQQEKAFYQTISSQYKARDTEVFVTILIPHERGADLNRLMSQFSLLTTSAPYGAVGLEVPNGHGRSVLGVKIDLEREIARENIRPRYLYDLGKVRYGDFETDAHYFVGSLGGGTVHYSAANVLKVVYRGRVLMEALPNTHALQLDGGPDNHIGYSKWRVWQDSVSLDR